MAKIIGISKDSPEMSQFCLSYRPFIELKQASDNSFVLLYLDIFYGTQIINGTEVQKTFPETNFSPHFFGLSENGEINWKNTVFTPHLKNASTNYSTWILEDRLLFAFQDIRTNYSGGMRKITKTNYSLDELNNKTGGLVELDLLDGSYNCNLVESSDPEFRLWSIYLSDNKPIINYIFLNKKSKTVQIVNLRL
jgi:hypothetical protein